MTATEDSDEKTPAAPAEDIAQGFTAGEKLHAVHLTDEELAAARDALPENPGALLGGELPETALDAPVPDAPQLGAVPEDVADPFTWTEFLGAPAGKDAPWEELVGTGPEDAKRPRIVVSPEAFESVAKASSFIPVLEKSPIPRAPRGKVIIAGHFLPEVKTQLQKLSEQRKTSVQNLLGEALNDLFIKYKKPPIA